MSFLNELHTFDAVASCGGFSKAAEQLDVSKGLVSRHIKTLEAHFQTRLFHRTTRRVTLTEAGKRLFDKTRQIERLARQAEDEVLDVSQEVTGELRVTMPDELGREIAREVIPAFLKAHPKVLLTMNFDLRFKDVEMGEFDVALRAVDQLPDNVVGKNLGVMKNVLVASPAYLAKCGVPQIPSDLLDHKVILSSHNMAWNCWTLSNGEVDEIVDLSGQIYVGVYGVAAELARQEQGITNMPVYQAMPLLKTGALVRVLPQWYQPLHRVSLVYAGGRNTPKKIANFNQAIVQWAKSHPDYFV